METYFFDEFYEVFFFIVHFRAVRKDSLGLQCSMFPHPKNLIGYVRSKYCFYSCNYIIYMESGKKVLIHRIWDIYLKLWLSRPIISLLKALLSRP